MNRHVNTRFLSDPEKAQVQSIMVAFGITGFDASVRLWGRGKTIEVSGSLDKLQLSCLLAIARYLDDEGDRTDSRHPIYTPDRTAIHPDAAR